jgi:hypothetical protein
MMFQTTKIMSLCLATAALALLWSNCGSDHSNVRFVHAAVSNIALDVAVDGKTVASNLAYGGISPATGYLTVKAGSQAVQMSTAGTTDNLINSTISFASGRHYTLVASGFVAPQANSDFNIAAILLTDDNSAPQAGNVKFRILHAAPFDPAVETNPPNLDIYIVPPGTDISSVTPNVSNLTYGQASAYQSVAATTNRVVVTAAGSKSTIIDQTYDTLAAGQIRTLIIVNDPDSTNVSATPVVLADLN